MMTLLSVSRMLTIVAASTAAILYFDGVMAAVLIAWFTVCAGAWQQRRNNTARKWPKSVAEQHALLLSLAKPRR